MANAVEKFIVTETGDVGDGSGLLENSSDGVGQSPRSILPHVCKGVDLRNCTILRRKHFRGVTTAGLQQNKLWLRYTSSTEETSDSSMKSLLDIAAI